LKKTSSSSGSVSPKLKPSNTRRKCNNEQNTRSLERNKNATSTAWKSSRSEFSFVFNDNVFFKTSLEKFAWNRRIIHWTFCETPQMPDLSQRPVYNSFYACKPHINHNLVRITPRIFNWWERSWLNYLYDRYDHIETTIKLEVSFHQTRVCSGIFGFHSWYSFSSKEEAENAVTASLCFQPAKTCSSLFTK
jgi:hypothetical protein